MNACMQKLLSHDATDVTRVVTRSAALHARCKRVSHRLRARFTHVQQ